MFLAMGEEKDLRLYLLVDPLDGVICDVRYQAFGPIALLAALEVAAAWLLRRTYVQAGHVSVDLLDLSVRDKKEEPAFSEKGYPFLRRVISAIDGACFACQHLPCEQEEIVSPLEGIEVVEGGIAGWESFSEGKKIAYIESVIEKEIRPYIELDAGGVEIVSLTDKGELTIAYQGACTTCYSATGSTLSAIQSILQARVHPSLIVVPRL